MPLKVTADHPHLEKGTPIAILGNLAIVENGSTVEVDDETLALYTEQTGKDAETAMASSSVLATGGDKPAEKRKKFEQEAEKQAKAAEAEASKESAEDESGNDKNDKE